MTNKSKLVAWDADFYKSLSDDVCFICLTEKQRYILGESLRQVEWLTRWQGDTSGLDFNSIRGNLEFRLSDMTSCSDIQTILDTVIDIDNRIQSIEVDIENIKNETDFDFPNGANGDTSITDVIPHSTLISPIGGYTSGCATDADRDALYGGCVALAEYMVQKVTDLLEYVDATTGQVYENIDKVIDAIPVVETLPIDDIFSLVEWITDHALEVWEATVTDDRKQELACLFYCFASNNSNCSLSLYDLVDLLNTKIGGALNLLKASIRDAVAIIAVGTPIGDDMFYSMLALEMVVVGQGQKWLDVNGFRNYEYRFAAGTNAPDNSWSIYCTDCPTYYRVFSQDFTNGLGDFSLEIGDLQANGVASIVSGNNQIVRVDYVAPEDMVIEAIVVHYERVDGQGNGSYDTERFSLYAESPADTEQILRTAGFMPNADIERCANQSEPLPVGKYLRVTLGVDDFLASALVLLKRIDVWSRLDVNVGRLVNDDLPC